MQQLFFKTHFLKFLEGSHHTIINEIKARKSFNLSSEEEATKIVEQFQYPLLCLDTKSYTPNVHMTSPTIAAFYGPVPKTDTKEIAVVSYKYELSSIINHKQIYLYEFKPLQYTDTIYKVELGDGYKELSFLIPTSYSSIELPEIVILDVVRKRDKVLEAVQANVNTLNESLTEINQSMYKTAFDTIQKHREHLAKMEYVNSRL